MTISIKTLSITILFTMTHNITILTMTIKNTTLSTRTLEAYAECNLWSTYLLMMILIMLFYINKKTLAYYARLQTICDKLGHLLKNF